jgi:predicted ester cyclase
MSTDNKTLVRNAIEEIYNDGNLNLADEIAATNFVPHDATLNTGTGPTGLKNHANTLRTAFPDLHLNIEEMHADGDAITTRLTIRGTHKGTLLNIPPTGRSINTTGTLISHVKNGKMIDSFMNWDALGVMQQIGAVQNLGQTRGRGAT